MNVSPASSLMGDRFDFSRCFETERGESDIRPPMPRHCIIKILLNKAKRNLPGSRERGGASFNFTFITSRMRMCVLAR